MDGELSKAGKKGDNITPHHIPSNAHMNKNGVAKKDGVSINMEQPAKGGRHRQTATYGNSSDKGLKSRDALARGVKDAKAIYQKDGLYNQKTREALQQVISENKQRFPDLFEKTKQ